MPTPSSRCCSVPTNNVSQRHGAPRKCDHTPPLSCRRCLVTFPACITCLPISVRLASEWTPLGEVQGIFACGEVISINFLPVPPPSPLQGCLQSPKSVATFKPVVNVLEQKEEELYALSATLLWPLFTFILGIPYTHQSSFIRQPLITAPPPPGQ